MSVNGARTGSPIATAAYEQIAAISAQITPTWPLVSTDFVDGAVEIVLHIPCCSSSCRHGPVTCLIGLNAKIVREDLPWAETYAHHLDLARRKLAEITNAKATGEN